jgi:hypothetical protein
MTETPGNNPPLKKTHPFVRGVSSVLYNNGAGVKLACHLLLHARRPDIVVLAENNENRNRSGCEFAYPIRFA